MGSLTIETAKLFRNRDFFVHDGARLRRIRLTASVQCLLVALLFSLVAWSAYATTQMIAAPSAPVVSEATRIAAVTEVRAARIEQRQEIIMSLLAGEDVSDAQLAEAARLSRVPGQVDPRVERAERAQQAHAALAAEALDSRYRDASRQLRKLGISPTRLNGGMGGPLEPVGKADPTFKQLFTSWKKLDNLHSNAIAVPADKPVKTASFTSGYGVRSDPFQGRAAMHAGIDLSGPTGTPIYATADGTVSTAGWNSGGYGNLIKIDHGRGIETRYAHLASITIKAGDRVSRGQLIGRMGSTGRSTGSHLHYEVRIDGKAVNPVPFMKATDYLLAMQRNANSHAMDAVALGGPRGGNPR